MLNKPRYSSIKDFDIQQGDGVNVSLWLQGCCHKCRECHNPETWDLSENSGKPFTELEVDMIVSKLSFGIDKNLSILGGEPLLPRNYEMLDILVKKVKNARPNTKIWLWTGFEFENIKDLNVVKYVDVLIDGKYVSELREVTRYKGSKNQRVIDVQKSLQQNKVIIYK